MENSITTTTGNQAQLSISPSNTPIHMYPHPTHPNLADQFVPYFGVQNLPESTTIRIYEISRFNSGGTQTTGRQLIIPIREYEQHPTSEFVDLLGSQNLPESATVRIYEISRFNSGGTTVATQTTGQHIIPIGENEDEHPISEFEYSNDQDDQRVMATLSIELSNQGGTIGVSNEEINNLTLTENVLPDNENQNESTGTSMENPGDDSSNHPLIATQIAEPPHTALLHDYWNPKTGTYFVAVYPTIATLLSFKFIAQKYSPFDTHIPFMIISIVAYLMAILDLAILFCLYDSLKRPCNQHFSRGHYKILTYAFYILLILATVLVVPTFLFTPQPKADP